MLYDLSGIRNITKVSLLMSWHLKSARKFHVSKL